MPEITVCTINCNTSRYIQLQDHILRRLASSADFKRQVIDFSPNSEISYFEKLPNTKAFSVDIGTLWGSDAHGRGVNMILENIDTEYGLLIDPDAVLLAPEWDRLLSRELSDGCIAIGSPYPPEYGKQRHQNFPNACIFFFKVAPLLELAIDWEPLFPQKYRNLLMALIKYSGIRIQDYEMGWRVPKAFAKKGYVGKSFKYITPTDSSAVLLQPESDFQEFHWNGEVVASHQRRSQHEFYGTSHSCAWVDALVKYVSDIGIEVKPFVDT